MAGIAAIWHEKFQPLAIYNSEVARGVIHTQAWVNEMMILQEQYDDKIQKHCNVQRRMANDILKEKGQR